MQDGNIKDVFDTPFGQRVGSGKLKLSLDNRCRKGHTLLYKLDEQPKENGMQGGGSKLGPKR